VWNAAGLSSGLYLLEMTAREIDTPTHTFHSLKKVLLQK
jgi:hypothetical protein